jgi:hypothetical protein
MCIIVTSQLDRSTSVCAMDLSVDQSLTCM